MNRRILLINGPNLNLLGKREPGVYGSLTLDEIVDRTHSFARSLNVELGAVQANGEGELVDAIHKAVEHYSGIVINPGAYTHTSIALRDAIQGVSIPCVEVHLSNVHAREDFRRRSFTAPACIGVVAGFGHIGYRLALEGLVEYLDLKEKAHEKQGR